MFSPLPAGTERDAVPVGPALPGRREPFQGGVLAGRRRRSKSASPRLRSRFAPAQAQALTGSPRFRPWRWSPGARSSAQLDRLPVRPGVGADRRRRSTSWSRSCPRSRSARSCSETGCRTTPRRLSRWRAMLGPGIRADDAAADHVGPVHLPDRDLARSRSATGCRKMIVVEVAGPDRFPARSRIGARHSAADCSAPVHLPDRGLAGGVLPHDVGIAVVVEVAGSDRPPARSRIGGHGAAADRVFAVHLPDRGLAGGVLPQDVGKPVVIEVAGSDRSPGWPGIGGHRPAADRGARRSSSRPRPGRLVFCHRMSEFPSPLKSPVPTALQPGPGLAGDSPAAGPGVRRPFPRSWPGRRCSATGCLPPLAGGGSVARSTGPTRNRAVIPGDGDDFRRPRRACRSSTTIDVVG